MKNQLQKVLKPKLKLAKGTRFVSFLFIASSIIIAAGVLFAANMYYDIDTGEVVMEEVNRVTGNIRATAGLIIGGSDSQDPASGTKLEIASDDVLLSAANQVLRFSGGTNYYVGLKAPTDVTSSQTYILPQHGTTPPSADYVLTYQAGDQLAWKSIGGAGGGDIDTVGDCTTGACFTTGAGGTSNSLWFEGSSVDDYEIELTAADPDADYTITLPAATGQVAFGTSTADYVAYWTSTSTLAGEQYLSTGRGGIGESSSAWSGMVKVVGGNWDAVTGTSNYATYWSDNNTIAAEQYLSVSRGGTGKGSWTQWGLLYADTTGSLANTTQGSADNLLVGAGAGSPTWKTISQLLSAGNNISLTGTTDVTIATVNNPTFSTSVTSPSFLSTTSLQIQSGNSEDITIDSASGKIALASGDWIETNLGYEIGKTGTEVLREMIPIMGFDLPVQTATTSYVSLSRVIEDYPFAAAASGSTRIHKLIFRYAASTTAAIPFQVYTDSDYASSTLPIPQSIDLAKGEAYITQISIPTSTTAWHLNVKTANEADTVRIFEVMLAAYDEIQ